MKSFINNWDITQESVHGFKVFSSNWTCSPYDNPKQYVCPGKFEEDVIPDACVCGMHFCKKVADCFNYYKFDPENKVAEVIAYGEISEEGDLCCTNKLKIVREISWDEVLCIVNAGKNCTGRGNTGDYNAGNYNTGYCNTKDYNTGNYNAGKYNSGNRNTGNCNIGECNTGNHNTGNFNTGCRNAGIRNTGDDNTGNYNTGDYNTGDHNTGDWNKSSFNTGCFMTVEQKISMFNKPSDWTYDDWCYSTARYLLNQMPSRKMAYWVKSENMTDDEKTEYPSYETTGGYLKVLDQIERRQAWWNSLTGFEKDTIKALPNFDPDIFEECTGIKID